MVITNFTKNNTRNSPERPRLLNRLSYLPNDSDYINHNREHYSVFT